MWSDISNAMRGFKNHSLHMLVLDKVLGLEPSNFSLQLKLKPGIDNVKRLMVPRKGIKGGKRMKEKLLGDES